MVPLAQAFRPEWGGVGHTDECSLLVPWYGSVTLFAAYCPAHNVAPQSEKQKYRDYRAIRNLISMEKRDMKQAFNTRLESEGNVRTLTQLSYGDVSRVLQTKGIE